MNLEDTMLDAQTLRAILDYDAGTGEFHWKRDVVTGNGAVRLPAGSTAGTITSKNYRQIGIFGRVYKSHRLAWLMRRTAAGGKTIGRATRGCTGPVRPGSGRP